MGNFKHSASQSNVNDSFLLLQSVIRVVARSISTGNFDASTFQTMTLIYDELRPRLPPKLQALLLALHNFVGAIHTAAPSSGINQIRIPRFCLESLFGPTICTQLNICGCTVDAAVSIGWCNIQEGTGSLRQTLPVANLPCSDTSECCMETFPEHDHEHVLLLIFKMLEHLRKHGPTSEIELVRQTIKDVPCSWTSAAVALCELRNSSIVIIRGTSIMLTSVANCEQCEVTFWQKIEASPSKDEKNVSCVVAFVPDETVFAVQPMLPITWSTRSWEGSQRTCSYFEQLIERCAAATRFDFMSVAHALHECLGSVVKAMVMLLDERVLGALCMQNCQLMVSTFCAESADRLESGLKCPFCGFAICTPCLEYLCSQDRLPDATPDSSSFITEVCNHSRRTAADFAALYCCPDPACKKLLPPPFWQRLVQSFDDKSHDSKKSFLAQAIFRRVTCVDDPFVDPCMITCKRCDRYLAASSRLEAVRCVKLGAINIASQLIMFADHMSLR